MHVLIRTERFKQVATCCSWRPLLEESFPEAIIETDGTMIVTTGACKEGMGHIAARQRGQYELAEVRVGEKGSRNRCAI
jgi:hypothetical protein